MDIKKLLKLAKILIELKEYELPEGKKLVVADGLEVGVEVFDENGDVLADGEYVVDGKKVKVEGGKIAEIETVEPEDKPVEEEHADEQPKEDEQPEEQPEVKPEDEPKEDEKPEEEVEPEKDAKDIQIAELQGIIADRDSEIAQLKEQVAQLEEKIAKPVEEPIKMNKVDGTKPEEKKGALRFFVDK